MARCRPLAANVARRLSFVEADDRIPPASAIIGVGIQNRISADLNKPCGVGRNHRTAFCHRLQWRNSKTFRSGRKCKAHGIFVERRQLVVANETGMMNVRPLRYRLIRRKNPRRPAGNDDVDPGCVERLRLFENDTDILMPGAAAERENVGAFLRDQERKLGAFGIPSQHVLVPVGRDEDFFLARDAVFHVLKTGIRSQPCALAFPPAEAARDR